MEKIFYDYKTCCYFTTTMKELMNWEFKLFSDYRNGLTKTITHNYIREHIFGQPPVIIADYITYNLPIEFEICPFIGKGNGEIFYGLNILESKA